MLIPNAVSAEFFHTDAGTAFVDLLINGNRETWPVRSKRFRNWLRRRHYEIARTAASNAAINSALDLLEAQAQFEGAERDVFAWRSMPATSISISPMNTGAPSRSDPTDGASSARLRCASAVRQACCRRRSPTKAAGAFRALKQIDKALSRFEPLRMKSLHAAEKNSPAGRSRSKRASGA